MPYLCAGGGGIAGATACMKAPAVESISYFETLTSAGVLWGNVDSTSHLRNSKVYIFNGLDDSVVNHGNFLLCYCNWPILFNPF